MLSALIPSQHSYPAVQLALKPVHQRLVQLGPLVLKSDPLKLPTPITDRDRTVSRRSEPSSRATLMGEQPIKVARELGSERRETVRSLSVMGVGSLRGSDLSTRGPGWTNRWCTGCSASCTAG